LRKHYFVLLVLVALFAHANAQDPYDGETLISPLSESNSYMLDMDGTVIRTWHGAHRPASDAYMFADKSILRPCRIDGAYFNGGGAGGRLQMIDSTDTVIWDFTYSSYDYLPHHDIEPLPNGNVLMIAWERKTAQEASDAGRVSATSEMWPTYIVEIEPVGATGGNIVWEWHAWDHLVQDADPGKPNYGAIADHPERIDINYGSVGGPQGGDWIHANAIDFNEELDQIVFSSRSFNEIYVIDHSTTTAEAAGSTGGNSGMGGDILYRWGNPEVYGRGSSSDQYFFVVHGVNWIDPGLPGEGNLLAFNNGDRTGTSNDYSSADEIVPPVDAYGNYSIDPDSAFGPAAPVWSYSDPGSFYAGPTHCGAYRHPNGNTLITSCQAGYVFEVTESGETVWDYSYPASLPRAQRYWDIDVAVASGGHSGAPERFELTANAPNPFNPITSVGFTMPTEGRVQLSVFDVAGRRVALLADSHYTAGRHTATWDGRSDSGREYPSGVYFVRMVATGFSSSRKMILVR